MEIQIDDEYKLKTDKLNFMVGYNSVSSEDSKNPGETVFKPIGFWSTLEGALKGYKKYVLLNSEAIIPDEILGKLKEVDQNIENIASKFNF